MRRRARPRQQRKQNRTRDDGGSSANTRFLKWQTQERRESTQSGHTVTKPSLKRDTDIVKIQRRHISLGTFHVRGGLNDVLRARRSRRRLRKGVCAPEKREGLG